LLKKKQRNIIVFIPSIEGGGVEKNLFLIINFLIKNNFNIVLITANPESKNKFHKKIKFCLYLILIIEFIINTG